MLLELRMGNILDARVNKEQKKVQFFNIKIAVLENWFFPLFKLLKVFFSCVGGKKLPRTL